MKTVLGDTFAKAPAQGICSHIRRGRNLGCLAPTANSVDAPFPAETLCSGTRRKTATLCHGRRSEIHPFGLGGPTHH